MYSPVIIIIVNIHIKSHVILSQFVLYFSDKLTVELFPWKWATEYARTGFWGLLHVLQNGRWNIQDQSYCSIFMNILACLYFYYTCGVFVDTCTVVFWGFVAHSLDTGNPEGVMHVFKAGRHT
jgi:hypothetical protein